MAPAASLFSPLQLPASGVTLSNRLVMAPMPTFAAHADGSASAAELAYYARRAPGLGAVITAGCSVSSEGLCFPGQWRCDRDDFIPSLRAVAAAIRPHAVPVLQLCHDGGRIDQIHAAELVEAFGSAARRAAAAGFPIVEIHGGHRYLLHQLFSRRNRRAGSWGGPTAAERARLPAAVLEACRKHLPCWYRLDPEEEGDDGISFDEALELAAILAAGGAEVFDVAARRYEQGSTMDPNDARPRAPLLAAALGDSALVIGVGGIETSSEAAGVLADGCALVGLGSVLLAQPDWTADVRGGGSSERELRRPSSDTLRSLAVPDPVIRYLARRGRLSDAD